MIEVKNVSKYFGDKQILFGVNTEFRAGKINAVIGKSGSGKTVLLKSIVGLHTVDDGEILFNNVNMAKLKPKERVKVRQDIGMLFQGSALFDSANIIENVLYPLDLFTDKTQKEKEERARFCLDRVNLPDAERLYPGELSGGMQKRAAIARAIALNPKYLFCDEPNSGLDPQTAIVIDKLIEEITYEFNITTVVNTHDMNSVLETSDNIVFIHEGSSWWHGHKEELLNTDNPELNKFLYSSEIMRRINPSAVQ